LLAILLTISAQPTNLWPILSREKNEPLSWTECFVMTSAVIAFVFVALAKAE